MTTSNCANMLSCCAAGTHLSWARSGLGPNFAENLLHCTANYFGHTGAPGGHIPQRPAIRRTGFMEYPRDDDGPTRP